MSLRISCAGVTTVDVDGWRTGDGLPDITVFGTSEDTGSDEDRWSSAFVGGSFRVFSVFRGGKLASVVCRAEPRKARITRKKCGVMVWWWAGCFR